MVKGMRNWEWRMGNEDEKVRNWEEETRNAKWRMRNRKALVKSCFPILLLLTLVLPLKLFAQEVGLTAKVDSSHYRLADVITVHIEARLPQGVDSIAPALRDSLGSFEVIGVAREGTQPLWSVQLMTLDTGKVFIPPIPFSYRVGNDTGMRTASSNPLFLTVSGVTVDTQGEIKDIKPPVDAPWKFEDVVPYLIGFLVLAGAGWWYYYYRKKQQERVSVVHSRIAPAPHAEALKALRLVEEKKLWQQGKVKQYYSEVTEIIRKFFEGRWGIVALEMTSDEILQQMKHFPEALKVWKEMQSLFTTADLVKFAKYEPTPAEHENELRCAYDIVRGMVPVVKALGEVDGQPVEAGNVRR